MAVFFLDGLAQTPTFEWARSIGGIYNDYSYDVALDDSGNIYTTGYFQGTVDFDPGPDVVNLNASGQSIFVSKLDAAGNLVWAKSVSGTNYCGGASITLDQTGNIYLTGLFSGTIDFNASPENFYLTSIEGSKDVFICKLNGSGSFVWAKQIGGIGFDGAGSIAIDLVGSGDICIAGRFSGTVDFDPSNAVFNLSATNGATDIFICKLNTSGNFLWAKQIGGSGSKSCRQIRFDSGGNGDIYAVGWFDDTVDFNPDPLVNFNLTSTNYDIFICKLSSSGDFIWAKQIGGAGFDKGMSMTVDAEGNGDLVLTGVYQGTVDFDPGVDVFDLTSQGDFDRFIVKLTDSGNFVWAKTMGGVSIEYSYSVGVDNIGNIYTTGYFRATSNFNPNSSESYNLTSAGDDDIFISKLSTNGDFLWAKQIGGYGIDLGLSLTTDTYGNLFLTGVFFSSTINFDSTTLTNAFDGGYTPDIFIAKINQSTTGLNDSYTTKVNVVYPNPSNTKIFFDLPNNQQSKSVTILDLTGKTIKSIMTNSNTIDIADLPNGIYIVNIQGSEGTIAQKIVKE